MGRGRWGGLGGVEMGRPEKSFILGRSASALSLRRRQSLENRNRGEAGALGCSGKFAEVLLKSRALKTPPQSRSTRLITTLLNVRFN